MLCRGDENGFYVMAGYNHNQNGFVANFHAVSYRDLEEIMKERSGKLATQR